MRSAIRWRTRCAAPPARGALFFLDMRGDERDRALLERREVSVRDERGGARDYAQRPVGDRHRQLPRVLRDLHPHEVLLRAHGPHPKNATLAVEETPVRSASVPSPVRAC